MKKFFNRHYEKIEFYTTASFLYCLLSLIAILFTQKVDTVAVRILLILGIPFLLVRRPLVCHVAGILRGLWFFK